MLIKILQNIRDSFVTSKWPDQSDPNLTQILDPEGQRNPTWPKFRPLGPNPIRNWVGFESGLLKYMFGLNPNLDPFWGQPLGRIGRIKLWPCICWIIGIQAMLMATKITMQIRPTKSSSLFLASERKHLKSKYLFSLV